jgi:hypothetical protein
MLKKVVRHSVATAFANMVFPYNQHHTHDYETTIGHVNILIEISRIYRSWRTVQQDTFPGSAKKEVANRQDNVKYNIRYITSSYDIT